MPLEHVVLERRRQYEIALDAIKAEPIFQVKSLAERYPAAKDHVIKRVVGHLADEGWLTRERRRDGVWFAWNGDPDKFAAAEWARAKTDFLPISESPVSDRPRERLLQSGAASLRIAELLAILIRSGRAGESALQSGEKIAQAFAQRLPQLIDLRPAELRGLSAAVGSTAYCQIMAGIELGRRVAEQIRAQTPLARIASTCDAIAFCREHFHRLAHEATQEEFHIVCLDTKNQVQATHRIFVGTLNASLVHPREIFRAAIKEAAHSVLLVHNHPSGDPTPSREDFAATERLEKSGELLGVNVLDHIVVARQGCVSIRECR